MSLRLLTLLTTAAVFIGGCGQSHLAQMTEDLSGLGNLDIASAGAPDGGSSSMAPVDVIYDKPAPAAVDPAQPQKAAAWGETSVQAPDTKIGGWGDTSVEKTLPSAVVAGTAREVAPAAAPVKVADGWHAQQRMV